MLYLLKSLGLFLTLILQGRSQQSHWTEQGAKVKVIYSLLFRSCVKARLRDWSSLRQFSFASHSPWSLMPNSCTSSPVSVHRKTICFSQHAWCINRCLLGLKVSKLLPRYLTSREWQVIEEQNSVLFSVTRPSFWPPLLCLSFHPCHLIYCKNWVSVAECFHHITC